MSARESARWRDPAPYSAQMPQQMQIAKPPRLGYVTHECTAHSFKKKGSRTGGMHACSFASFVEDRSKCHNPTAAVDAACWRMQSHKCKREEMLKEDLSPTSRTTSPTQQQ